MRSRVWKQPSCSLEAFRGLHIVGRWLLFGAEAIVTLLLLLSQPTRPETRLILAGLLLYDALSLVIVHRVAIDRLPALALLTLDLLFVGLVALHTGRSESPFLGLCYLIIFAGSLFYGLPGGMAVSGFSVLLVLLLAYPRPEALQAALQDRIPYFLLTGAFTGHLVGQLRTAFRLHRASLLRERQREVAEEVVRRELELARGIQGAALPSRPPEIPGLEIAARCEFARTVGGDFFLFLPEGTRLGLVIGDASGKGVPAALVATSIAHLLPWLEPLRSPLEALGRLNRDLFERLPKEAYASLTLAEIDLERDLLRLWPAGHPPALLRRARAGAVVLSATYNRPLGMFAHWEGSVETWSLEPGDVLLLYSDGLIEARNEEREPFGEERVAEVLRRVGAESADAIANALTAAAREWGQLLDDLTLLVVRRVGASTCGDKEGAEARRP